MPHYVKSRLVAKLLNSAPRPKPTLGGERLFDQAATKFVNVLYESDADLMADRPCGLVVWIEEELSKQARYAGRGALRACK
jgi:hypothetical protein